MSLLAVNSKIKTVSQANSEFVHRKTRGVKLKQEEWIDIQCMHSSSTCGALHVLRHDQTDRAKRMFCKQVHPSLFKIHVLWLSLNNDAIDGYIRFLELLKASSDRICRRPTGLVLLPVPHLDRGKLHHELFIATVLLVFCFPESIDQILDY